MASAETNPGSAPVISTTLVTNKIKIYFFCNIKNAILSWYVFLLFKDPNATAAPITSDEMSTTMTTASSTEQMNTLLNATDRVNATSMTTSGTKRLYPSPVIGLGYVLFAYYVISIF